jgi:hypothetical protein
MALNADLPKTFTPLGGRVSDIFTDIGVQQAGALKAKGLRLGVADVATSLEQSPCAARPTEIE